jgi:hypothetical protein
VGNNDRHVCWCRPHQAGRNLRLRVWFVDDATVAEHIDGEKRLDARQIEIWLAELEQSRKRVTHLEAAMTEANLEFHYPYELR